MRKVLAPLLAFGLFLTASEASAQCAHRAVEENERAEAELREQMSERAARVTDAERRELDELFAILVRTRTGICRDGVVSRRELNRLEGVYGRLRRAVFRATRP